MQVLGFLLPFLPLSGIIKLEYRLLFLIGGMGMKRMRLLSLLLALVLVCTAMPVTAAAADGLANATVCTTHTVHTEGQSAEDCTGLAPYLAPDGTA